MTKRYQIRQLLASGLSTMREVIVHSTDEKDKAIKYFQYQMDKYRKNHNEYRAYIYDIVDKKRVDIK